MRAVMADNRHDATIDVMEIVDAVFVWRCPAPVSLTHACPYPKVWGVEQEGSYR